MTLSRWILIVENAFAAWFGSSKIVDKSGAPLRVYHGTGGNIEAFDRENPRMKKGKLGRGIYLTPSTAKANLFARMRAKDGPENVMPLYAKIENPYEVHTEANIPVTGIDRVKLENHGYDGVVLYYDDGSIAEVVAFRSEQVKSAIGNRGSYNPNDPRITEGKSQR
jgi:hypothetical protein